MRNFILALIMVVFFNDTVLANAPNFATSPLNEESEETLQLLSATTDAESAKIFSEIAQVVIAVVYQELRIQLHFKLCHQNIFLVH